MFEIQHIPLWNSLPVNIVMLSLRSNLQKTSRSKISLSQLKFQQLIFVSSFMSGVVVSYLMVMYQGSLYVSYKLVGSSYVACTKFV